MSITLTITESDNQFVSGIPEYVTLSASSPATIFYTTNGDSPLPDESEIYVDYIFMPTDRSYVSLKILVLLSSGVIEEFEHEVEINSEAKEEEFGDLIFSLVNYARFVNISPESALSKTNIKFISRFQLMENLITNEGLKIEGMSLVEMDVFWDKAKASLKNNKAIKGRDL